MKHNFDEIQPRRGTHSIKWDASKVDDVLPMWIADMDFGTFPPIIEAISQTVKQGHYGYNTTPDAFCEAIIIWWQKRHQCTIKKEWILPTTGVVAGLSAIFTALLEPGDGIIIQTPAYNHFYNTINGAGCIAIENELIYEDGVYRIDFDGLERMASSPRIKMMLLCNPHNPVGRAWTEFELQSIGTICAKHGVYVVSDEIHSDLLAPGIQHCSYLEVATEQHPSIIVSAASKTFNLSGLHAAYIFTFNEELRKKIESQLWARAAASPSLIACEAVRVAYTEGDEWVDQLNDYIQENYKFLQTFINTHLNNITVLPLEATYLVWLDCKETGIRSTELSDMLLKKEKLWVNPGTMYGAAGDGFLRLNIACPREMLEEGLSRLKRILGPQ